MKFYEVLENILQTSSIKEKEALIKRAFLLLDREEFDKDFSPKDINTPSYAKICKIVDPKTLPLRKNFDSDEGMAKLLHSIVHIEYSAIDLAVDAVYRYPFMPKEFKKDWLEVALEEIRHFKMLEEILRSLGYKYGDFPVHSGLMDAAYASKEDILERMAVVPRYYEAGGLDVNPQIMKKVDSSKHPFKERVLEALKIIYKEEISHVYKGDKWFRYLCKERGVSENIYFDILQKYNLLKKHRPYVNVEARKKAGFSCEEILKLGAKRCD